MVLRERNLCDNDAMLETVFLLADGRRGGGHRASSIRRPRTRSASRIGGIVPARPARAMDNWFDELPGTHRGAFRHLDARRTIQRRPACSPATSTARTATATGRPRRSRGHHLSSATTRRRSRSTMRSWAKYSKAFCEADGLGGAEDEPAADREPSTHGSSPTSCEAGTSTWRCAA